MGLSSHIGIPLSANNIQSYYDSRFAKYKGLTYEQKRAPSKENQ
jgi:hypothetical protein